MARSSFLWRLKFDDSEVKYVKAQGMDQMIYCDEIDMESIVNIDRLGLVGYFTDLDYPDMIEIPYED